MKTNCNIIKDLLPLYAEDMLSEESAALVKEHLSECPDCSMELMSLKDDTRKRKVEKDVAEAIERKNELKRLNKRMNRRSVFTFLLVLLLTVTTVYAVNSTRLLYRELSPPEIRFDYPDRNTTNDTNLAQNAIFDEYENDLLRNNLRSITVKEDKNKNNRLEKINKELKNDEQFTDCILFSLTFENIIKVNAPVLEYVILPYSETYAEDWLVVKQQNGEWIPYLTINEYGYETLLIHENGG